MLISLPEVCRNRVRGFVICSWVTSRTVVPMPSGLEEALGHENARRFPDHRVAHAGAFGELAFRGQIGAYLYCRTRLKSKSIEVRGIR